VLQCVARGLSATADPCLYMALVMGWNMWYRWRRQICCCPRRELAVVERHRRGSVAAACCQHRPAAVHRHLRPHQTILHHYKPSLPCTSSAVTAVFFTWTVSPSVYPLPVLNRTSEDKWHRFFCELDALYVTQTTVSRHWRKQKGKKLERRPTKGPKDAVFCP